MNDMMNEEKLGSEQIVMSELMVIIVLAIVAVAACSGILKVIAVGVMLAAGIGAGILGIRTLNKLVLEQREKESTEIAVRKG